MSKADENIPNDPRSGELWTFGLLYDPGHYIAHQDDLSRVGMSIMVIVFSVTLSRLYRDVGFGSIGEFEARVSGQIEV